MVSLQRIKTVLLPSNCFVQLPFLDPCDSLVKRFCVSVDQKLLKPRWYLFQKVFNFFNCGGFVMMIKFKRKITGI